MSIERELLERVMNLIDYRYAPSEAVAVHREIKELLAQPEQSSTTRHALDSYWESESYQRGYAQAELDLKREPLTPQQISEGNQSMFNVTREAFIKGIRFAEKMHGIGGGG